MEKWWIQRRHKFWIISWRKTNLHGWIILHLVDHDFLECLKILRHLVHCLCKSLSVPTNGVNTVKSINKKKTLLHSYCFKLPLFLSCCFTCSLWSFNRAKINHSPTTLETPTSTTNLTNPNRLYLDFVYRGFQILFCLYIKMVRVNQPLQFIDWPPQAVTGVGITFLSRAVRNAVFPPTET